jgi:hypothetical protein
MDIKTIRSVPLITRGMVVRVGKTKLPAGGSGWNKESIVSI